jgi:hypothetical protein
MKSFFRTELWTSVAIYIGLCILNTSSVVENPVKLDRFGESLFLDMIVTVAIGIPYGILWYFLSRHSPKMRDLRYVVPPIVLMVVALGSWLNTSKSLAQGDFTLSYMALGAAAFMTIVYALALKSLGSNAGKF